MKMKAMFGAGCFWHVEDDFRKAKGVLSTAVGFAAGHSQNPTYKEVCAGQTGHAEVVQLEYDPDVITYEKLLDIFWAIHDPTTINCQGPDVGSQYRSLIVFYTPDQQKAALESKKKLALSGRFTEPIVTEIHPETPFYMAEDYHQQYLEKQRGA